MRSNDLNNRNEIRQAMQKALAENDAVAFTTAFDQLLEDVAQSVQQDFAALQAETDTNILAARGVRQLTSEERQYYQKLGEAMKDADVKQALANTDLLMPKTIIDSVFDELQASHPLLSKIQFVPTTALTEMVMNTNGYQKAAWGKLCDDIIKELASGFKTVDMTLLKLSAFIPVCKAMLELGPEWLDRYVRQVLFEALANGLEDGIVNGSGNGEPIGMTRQVGDNVTVTGGVYPLKEQIQVTDLSPSTIGNLLSLLAVDPNGKQRAVRDVILLVGPQDYFQKIMPATTLMAPDGSYRNDVMPYPMTIIQTPALSRGEAILGMAYKYFAGAGMAKDGRIEYSDQYKFLEDDRTYLIKLYANGFPMDNNAFMRLDISRLTPASYKVTVVDERTPSNNADLSSLSIGSAALSPTFVAATTTYTATTSNATNTIIAVPAEASAAIEIKAGGTVIENGTAATWASGSNTVEIKVTAADGTTTKTYKVTVTKE